VSVSSTVSKRVKASPADVWAVLADGWLYATWVVGASRIRSVDETWPAEGSSIHHSVGSWPFLFNDKTIATKSEPEKELEMRARAWPGGEALVRVSIEPEGEGSIITMTEDASAGPMLMVPQPVRKQTFDWRNTESLLRLGFLVENKARS
jgi:uncharacterized protein YndB with AHSA1/START domain